MSMSAHIATNDTGKKPHCRAAKRPPPQFLLTEALARPPLDVRAEVSQHLALRHEELVLPSLTEMLPGMTGGLLLPLYEQSQSPLV